MKRKITLAVLSVIAIILEILPYGAALSFANPEGEPFYKTYSYFSLVPFGYANFGPLITALLTVTLLILAIIFIFKQIKIIKMTFLFTSFLAVLFSLSPFVYGLSYFTPLGAIISITLLSQFLLILSET